MRRLGGFCLALLAIGASACTARHARVSTPEAQSSAPILFDNLGTHHHPVTTGSAEAQRYFDQGLRLIWAFNHDEATRAFQAATRIDPDCAMAWWGIALAAGPNYNDAGNRERDRRAYEALQKALALKPRVSEPERAYIDALAKRYTKEPPEDRKALDRAYADAMRVVAQRYPDDLDAATLFAESLMDLRPWDLWSLDGQPQPGTEEIVRTLEAVLARAPDHPGANHYYIHAVEASNHPERGVPAADRLRGLVPGAGHLVHMPAHIYMRVGRYDDAVAANVRAVAADRAYIASAKPEGLYPMMYFPHNLDFLWSAASMEGRSADTLQAARELSTHATPDMVRQMSDIEGAVVAPLFALARFGKWTEILNEPAPPDDLPFASGIGHYARGLAFTRTGRLGEARKELAALEKITAATPPARTLGQVNTAKNVLTLATHVLAGEIAAAHGRYDDAVRHLRTAVHLQDTLRYMEPPPWYYPVRQSLGAVLLTAGRPAQAAAVYREDLRRNPENGWSLYGLAQSLRAEHKNAEAAAVDARFRTAWARADVQLNASRF
jgi:tetratricopeptide (TPR) repeat protein